MIKKNISRNFLRLSFTSIREVDQTESIFYGSAPRKRSRQTEKTKKKNEKDNKNKENRLSRSQLGHKKKKSNNFRIKIKK